MKCHLGGSLFRIVKKGEIVSSRITSWGDNHSIYQRNIGVSSTACANRNDIIKRFSP